MEGYVTRLSFLDHVVFIMIYSVYEMKLFFLSLFQWSIRDITHNSILSRLCPDGIFLPQKQLINVAIHTSS